MNPTSSDFDTVDAACAALYNTYRTDWDAWINGAWQTHQTEYLALLASHGWTDAEYDAALQSAASAGLAQILGFYRS